MQTGTSEVRDEFRVSGLVYCSAGDFLDFVKMMNSVLGALTAWWIEG